MNADFTDLNKLTDATVNVSVESIARSGDNYQVTVNLENSSQVLAFAVNPKILKNTSKDLVTPVFWDDNYFSMMPGDKRTVTVQFEAGDLEGEQPILEVEGWNMKAMDVALK